MQLRCSYNDLLDIAVNRLSVCSLHGPHDSGSALQVRRRSMNVPRKVRPGLPENAEHRFSINR
jgi:hypothetical protein